MHRLKSLRGPEGHRTRDQQRVPCRTRTGGAVDGDEKTSGTGKEPEAVPPAHVVEGQDPVTTEVDGEGLGLLQDLCPGL